MEINAKTKLNDLLSAYPQLEEKVIQAAPTFKNLQNPVLRRTVGRVATVEKVVQIGGLDLTTFINLLRREVGLPELIRDETTELEAPGRTVAVEPEWIQGEPQFVVDGKTLLASGEVPVNQINVLLSQLATGRFILLVTDFEPVPMIEAITKQNRKAYHKLDPQDPNRHLTYFC